MLVSACTDLKDGAKVPACLILRSAASQCRPLNRCQMTNQARSQWGGQGDQLTPPLENQRSTFWNLAREIIKTNNYKWLTIYLHQLLCTKPPTKWLQNLLSKGGSGGANL